jgi:hypothetical protein
MTWTYRSEIFQEELIQDHIGFVYIITNLSNNRKYVGKKFFTKAASKQIKGKKKKIRVKSDWIDYFGSNEELKEEVKNLGGDNFHREIIHLCKTKAECSYRESYEIFIRDALLKEEYYNSWISCRIHKKHVIGKVSHGS